MTEPRKARNGVSAGADGVPLAATIEGANRNDCKLREATLDAVRWQPAAGARLAVCLDKGYDHALCRDLVTERGLEPHIQSRGEGTDTLAAAAVHAGGSWNAPSRGSTFRRLLARWERLTCTRLALLQFAAALDTMACVVVGGLAGSAPGASILAGLSALVGGRAVTAAMGSADDAEYRERGAGRPCEGNDGVAGRSGQRRADGSTAAGAPEGVVLDWLGSLDRPLRAVYEAGLTGYGLARAAQARGLDVAVCSPAHIARRGDRIKTDRRDGERLARLLLAGELVLVDVPSVEEEQFRDLLRAREAIRGDLMRARHRVSKFLLRRGIRYPQARGAWTLAHRDWLARRSFDDRASRVAFCDQLHAHDALIARRDLLDREIEAVVRGAPWHATVTGLRCFRGIDTLTGAGLQAEIGDWSRFTHPKLVASYIGIVPSEHSTGARHLHGPITKAGTGHTRRLLVEAAWHYRHQPSVSATLERRQRCHDPPGIDLTWRCQRRLYRRWQVLHQERGKPANVACVAVARELTCFL